MPLGLYDANELRYADPLIQADVSVAWPWTLYVYLVSLTFAPDASVTT